MGHKYIKENEIFDTSQNGVVPKPTAEEVADGKVLRADGTWVLGGGGSDDIGLSIVNGKICQTYGTE